MKKILSAVVSAAIAVSAALPFTGTSSAADDIKNIVVLGDSIASGYGLAEGEHSYGDIVGNYYGAKTDSFAKSGDETADLIAKLEAPTAEMSASIKDADYVLVSIGGNDILHYSSALLLKVCANYNLLKSGYTKSDIPEKPTFDDLIRLLDKEALKTFASDPKNTIALNSNLRALTANLTEKDSGKYDCVIQKRVIPNIKKIGADIKAMNPDAKVVYQTVYDPLQFDESYFNATYTGSTASTLNRLIYESGVIVNSFRDQLMEADLGGALIADVYTDFTSLDESGAKYSWYFTKMQSERSEMDFHPTQAGHVAIAAKVIDTIGIKDKGGDLIVQTFNKLPNKDSYPAAAYATYNKIVSSTSFTEPVTSTETTTTSTTTTTTTSTTTTSTTTTSTTSATTTSATTTVTTTVTTPPVTTIPLGDPNNDGSVDAKDASFVLAAYSKSSTGGDSGLSDEQKKAANINGDALVDAKDASMILGYYSYISTGGTKTIAEYFGL